MFEMEQPYSPEHKFSLDPIQDLLIVIRERFKEAFTHEDDVSKSVGNHPTMSAFSYRPPRGTFYKRDSLSVENVKTFKIMLKIPDTDPAHFDGSEQVLDSLHENGLGVRSLSETRILIYMPNLTSEEQRTMPEEKIDEVDQFIVQFHGPYNDAFYIINQNGIWPMAGDGVEQIDIEKEIAEFEETIIDDLIIDSEDENVVIDLNDKQHAKDRKDEVALKEAQRQYDLAMSWLEIFDECNLSAFK